MPFSDNPWADQPWLVTGGGDPAGFVRSVLVRHCLAIPQSLPHPACLWGQDTHIAAMPLEGGCAGVPHPSYKDLIGVGCHLAFFDPQFPYLQTRGNNTWLPIVSINIRHGQVTQPIVAVPCSGP